MPECVKCGADFPYWVLIEGRRRNLGSRRYCLNCSPFGSGNRRQLHVAPASRKEKQERKLQKRTGLACWACNYGSRATWKLMEFLRDDLEHVATVSTAARMHRGKIERYALLCCRCSREFRAQMKPREVLHRVIEQCWR